MAISSKTSEIQHRSSSPSRAVSLASLWADIGTGKIILAVALLLGLLAGTWGLQALRGGAAAMSLLIGAALGISFQRSRFCFFCIFRDWLEHRNSSGMMAVLVALAVGGMGYALLFSVWLPNPALGRLPPDAHIGPVSWLLGVAGVVFGLGMSLSGACISGHLYRLGEGYLRAIPALLGSVLGFGLGFLSWRWLYLRIIADAPTLWLPYWLGYGFSLLLHLTLLALLALWFLRYLPALPARDSQPVSAATVLEQLLRQRWSPLAGGTVVGLLGVVAYFRVEPLGVTAQLGSLARTTMDSVGWLSGSRLPGLDALAGCATVVAQAIGNNGWLIGGLVLGSLAAALLAGAWKPSRLTLRNSSSALLGGVLMGWASMVALGCTVGVLLSGVMAFSLSGWLFGIASILGVWIGLRLQLHRL